MLNFSNRHDNAKVLRVLLLVASVVSVSHASDELSSPPDSGADELDNLVTLRSYALSIGDGVKLTMGDKFIVSFEGELSSYASHGKISSSGDRGSVGAGYMFLEQESFGGPYLQAGFSNGSWRYGLEVSQLTTSETAKLMDADVLLIGLKQVKVFHF